MRLFKFRDKPLKVATEADRYALTASQAWLGRNVIQTGLPEITRVTPGADVAGSLNDTDFVLIGANGYVAIWFNVDGNGSGALGYPRQVEVAIASDDDADTVRDAVLAAMAEDPEFIAVADGSDILFTDRSVGVRDDAFDDSTGFSVTRSQAGENPKGPFIVTDLNNLSSDLGWAGVATEDQVNGATNDSAWVTPFRLGGWWGNRWNDIIAYVNAALTALKAAANTWTEVQTFSASAVLNGTNNTAPNQTAAGIGAGTLLNTGQVTWKILRDINRIQVYYVGRYTADRAGTGAGSIVGSGAGTQVDGGSAYAVGAYVIFNNVATMDNTTYSQNYFGRAVNSTPAGGGRGVFNKPFTLNFRGGWRVDSGTPCTLYFGVCETITNGAPAGRGYGFLVDATGLKLWQHDGSSLTTSASYISTGVTAPGNADVTRNVMLVGNGSGTMSLYYAEAETGVSTTATSTLTIPTSSTVFSAIIFDSVKCTGSFSSGHFFLKQIQGLSFAPYVAQ